MYVRTSVSKIKRKRLNGLTQIFGHVGYLPADCPVIFGGNWITDNNSWGHECSNRCMQLCCLLEFSVSSPKSIVYIYI